MSNYLLAVHGYGAIQTREAFAKGAEIALQLDDCHVTPELRVAQWASWSEKFSQGCAFEAVTIATEYFQEATKSLEPQELMHGTRMLGATEWCLGNYDSAFTHLTDSIAAYDWQRDSALTYRFGVDLRVAAKCYMPLVLWPIGRLQTAREVADMAMQDAHDTGNANTLAYACAFRCCFEAMRGDKHQTSRHAQKMLILAEQIKSEQWKAFSRVYSSWVQCHTEQYSKCSELLHNLQESRMQLCESGVKLFDPLICALFCQFYSAINSDRCIVMLDEAVSYTEKLGLRWYSAELNRHRGKCLIKSSTDFVKTEEAFSKAITIATFQGAPAFKLRASLDLARLYCDTGREREARDLLRRALLGFTETPEFPEIGAAQQLLASIA